MVYRNDTTSAERSWRRNRRRALWGVLALWVMMASSPAGAGTAFDIVDDTGTRVGSITFPALLGSSRRATLGSARREGPTPSRS